MIIYHQNNVAAFAGNHNYWFLPHQIIMSRVSALVAAAGGGLFRQSNLDGLGVGGPFFADPLAA